MRHLPSLVLLAALLSALPLASSSGAQASQPASSLSLAQAERMASDLKQGMSAEDVQKLLGKPRRTALKNDGGCPNTPSQGTLQWTYTWPSASGQGSLRVEFAAKSPEQWYVNSWEWVTY